MHKLATLHTGQAYVVINKPAGINVEKHFDHDTVEARALAEWRRPKATKPPYVGIVHRLDRPVSGALLLARNKSTLRLLNKAFEDKLVEKTYVALTEKPLPKPHGLLQNYLARDATNRKAVVGTKATHGAKFAELKYRLIETRTDGHLYEIIPITGRFHQIRVQLAHAGAPIVGDATYGAEREYQPNAICLHATKLIFPEPAGEGRVTVESVAKW